MSWGRAPKKMEPIWTRWSPKGLAAREFLRSRRNQHDCIIVVAVFAIVVPDPVAVAVADAAALGYRLNTVSQSRIGKQKHVLAGR